MTRLSAGFLQDPESAIVIAAQDSSSPWTVFVSLILNLCLATHNAFREIMGRKLLSLDEQKAAHIRQGLPVSMLEWIGDSNGIDGSDKLAGLKSNQ